MLNRLPRPGDMILDDECTLGVDWLPALVLKVYVRKQPHPGVLIYAYTVDLLDAKGERMLPQDVYANTNDWPRGVSAVGTDGIRFRVSCN